MRHGSRKHSTRDRHRLMRSPLQGPYLPPLTGAREQFYTTVADTGGYLVSLWPDDFRGLHLEVADIPHLGTDSTIAQPWHVDHGMQRIVLYRLPIQRATIMRGLDTMHRQMYIEYFVFRAFAEYVGKDPWELAPERFRPF